jgi:hypothetical protein
VFPEFSHVNIARSIDSKDEGVKLIKKANELQLKQLSQIDLSQGSLFDNN